VLLRTLLAHPELDLRVLAGDDGIDRRVHGIYTTDLADPSRYLCGGLLVLTGLTWWHGPDDSRAFVRTLAEGGVVALGAGAAEYGFVPDDLVDACRRYDVMLFEVPEHVSFATITELVVLALADERAHGVRAEQVALPEALRGAEAAVGVSCWLLSPTARVIVGEGVPAQRQQIVRRCLSTADRPAAGIPQGAVRVRSRGRTYAAWSTNAGSPLTGWVLVVASESSDLHRAQRRALDGLLDAARAELSRVDDMRRADASTCTAVVRAVLTPSPTPPDVLERLGATGLSERLCVATASVADDGPALALAILTELADYLGVAAQVAEVNGEVFALLAVEPERLERAVLDLSDAVQVLEPGLGKARLAVGVSAATSWPDIRRAAEESRYARRLAEQRSQRASVVGGADLAAPELLAAALPSGVRAAYRVRVLGPILAHDAEHQSPLLETLRVFLDCSGSWKAAAQRLHLHVNTLRYRIDRIAALTGRDLADLATRVEFYVALHLDQP
jgi:hypothetical protein